MTRAWHVGGGIVSDALETPTRRGIVQQRQRNGNVCDNDEQSVLFAALWRSS